MLAYILALAVGLGSFSIYMAAFFFPEVHRKSDFAWSGVGLFYALILWACAGRITGALLLGQMAGVALLGFLAWETLSLRRQVAPIAQQTPIPDLANLTGAAGGPLAVWFGAKKEAAPTKPKFVRSKKPKAEVAAPPVVDTAQVKVEEQPPSVGPVVEPFAESSIAEPTPSIAAEPQLSIPDVIPPTTEPIPVWSIETSVADTAPAPAESVPSSDTPLPLEISEIFAAATVEPAEPQPEIKPEPEVDDFEEAWRAAALGAAPVAVPTPTPPTPAPASKKSAGFGSLFDNLKNSLGGFLGRGSDKSKSPATAQVTTAKVPATAIEPVAEKPTVSAPELDRILESELAAAAREAAPETSSTEARESQGLPFPADVETMAEVMAAERVSSGEIGALELEPQATTVQTSPETEVAELADTTDTATAKVPASSPETTELEVVSVMTVKIQESTDAADNTPKLEVEAISIEVIPIEPSGGEASPTAEKAELNSSNSPEFDRVEAAKPAVESKSENISSEAPPTA